MKKKELKNFATKIAKLERIIQTNEDSKKVAQAQEEIMKLSQSVHSLDDMVLIDEMVMEILSENT